MTNAKRSFLKAALLGGALLLPGCGDFLEVTNPGPIPDEELDQPSAVPSLVTGMSYDLSQAMNQVVQGGAIMSDDLFHGGSYTAEGLWNRGVIRSEDVNTEWASMHQARWVAEQGIERMKKIEGFDFDKSPLAARAHLHAGFANRLLGENVCEAVIDGGPRQDVKVHFQRAEASFSEALRIAQAQTSATVRDSLSRAAYGGRASVRVWLGNWAGAAEDAARVPVGYRYHAVFSLNTPEENNDLVFETYNRREYTVFNTQWAKGSKDPRVPWDTVRVGTRIQTGQDGRTPFFQQRKFSDLGADVPLTKGTEMLMVRAEAALRNGDVAGAMALVNQQRAFHGLAALPVPSTPSAAWRVLQKERGAVTWLEARRFGDLRRWYAEGRREFMQEDDARLKEWGTRAQCIPVSRNEELSNPHLRG